MFKNKSVLLGDIPSLEGRKIISSLSEFFPQRSVLSQELVVREMPGSSRAPALRLEHRFSDLIFRLLIMRHQVRCLRLSSPHGGGWRIALAHSPRRRSGTFDTSGALLWCHRSKRNLGRASTTGLTFASPAPFQRCTQSFSDTRSFFAISSAIGISPASFQRGTQSFGDTTPFFALSSATWNCLLPLKTPISPAIRMRRILGSLLPWLTPVLPSIGHRTLYRADWVRRHVSRLGREICARGVGSLPGSLLSRHRQRGRRRWRRNCHGKRWSKWRINCSCDPKAHTRQSLGQDRRPRRQ